MPQLEGPATKIYNNVPGGIWGDKAEKTKDWQLVPGVSSGANLYQKKSADE